jgi:hypothetical protein
LKTLVLVLHKLVVVLEPVLPLQLQLLLLFCAPRHPSDGVDSLPVPQNHHHHHPLVHPLVLIEVLVLLLVELLVLLLVELHPHHLREPCRWRGCTRLCSPH